MRDHQVRAWLRVVDVSSIRGAARSLNLTQAAVTKAIRELEEELGAPLLVRSSRGIRLTDFGERLTPRLRLAHAQLELARQDIRQLQGGEHAQVGVALTPVVFLSVLPKVVAQFQAELPLAHLSVMEGLMNAVVPALRQGSIDFAVGAVNSDTLPTDLAIEPWQSLEIMVACRKGHPLANAASWSELAECTWLVHPTVDSQATHFFRWMEERGLGTPSRRTAVNTFGVTWSLLTHTDALLVCPRVLLDIPVYGDQITRIPLSVKPPSMSLGLVTLKEVPLSYAAERLVRLFRQALGANQAAAHFQPGTLQHSG